MHELPRPEGIVWVKYVDEQSGLTLQRAMKIEDVQDAKRVDALDVERFPIEAVPLEYHSTHN